MFRKILIANRGEIALRVVYACRELGIQAVAVYSEADREAAHVFAADEAHCIGPPSSVESYLNIPKILEVAQKAGAQAIHPGYGFLAENPDFAQACADAGLIFIGPKPEVIRLLGDKEEAKRLAESVGVPVVPGRGEWESGRVGEWETRGQGDQRRRRQEDNPKSEIRNPKSQHPMPNTQRLLRHAETVGFPLLIKAVAGGGGKGMRIVQTPEEFLPALESARREAFAAFGDDRVMLERYIPRSRHVEVQILGDEHGNLLHLFERECSIQRRHQKIIEESPSPVLAPELRARLTEAAVQVGKAAGYTNAGTIEFLFEERPDGDHQFYFLEVNTRLQVEHPVTEMVTGVDLVKLQILLAGGEPLPLRQADLSQRGHAIEARIYAEDPENEFLPSIGTLHHWEEPNLPGVRVDSGVVTGSEVTLHYDPLLAKMIAHAENREATLRRLEYALTQFHVLGVKTNIPFLLQLVRHPEFQAGRLHTDFIEEHQDALRAEPAQPPIEVLLALAAAEMSNTPSATPHSPLPTDGDPYSPWRIGGAWRIGGGKA